MTSMTLVDAKYLQCAVQEYEGDVIYLKLITRE